MEHSDPTGNQLQSVFARSFRSFGAALSVQLDVGVEPPKTSVILAFEMLKLINISIPFLVSWTGRTPQPYAGQHFLT